MSDTIPVAYIDTFEARVRHLAQQQITRLRPYVDERGDVGKSHAWDRMGLSEAAIKGSRPGDPSPARLVDTPNNNTEVSRRLSLAVTYDLGETSELEDPSQMLWDPNSNLVKAVAKGMRRAYDDEIIAAAVGSSRDEDGNAIAFPASQNIGDGTSPITFDIITNVNEIYLENDIDVEEPKIMVIGPKQARKLLQLTEATSMDYNTRDALRQGFVQHWMGYTWIVSTRLQEPDTDQIYCFSMTYDAIGLQVNMDMHTEVAKDPGKSFAWRIYCMAVFGAIRVEDEKLIRLHLANTV